MGGSAGARDPAVGPSPGGALFLQGEPDSPAATDSQWLLAVADTSFCSKGVDPGGSSPTLSLEGFVSNSCRALLRFDLSALPANAVIDSAALSLWLNSGGCSVAPCPDGVPTSAHLVTGPWQETTVTWGNQPSVQPDGVPKNVDLVVDYAGWDITGYARAWHTGTSANYGAELRCRSVDLGYYLYFSSREGAHSPFLGVVYHTVPLCDAVAQIPKTECEALVDLYNGTGGAGWTTKTNWLVTNTPCSWYGVTCASGHVTRLNLSGNHLAGVIPGSLSDLSSLQDLSLYSNQLSGGIPSALGSLTGLRSLVLNSNQLTGNIPTSLGNLSSLRLLFLHANQLTGGIPTSLGSLSNLTSLGLSGNQLTGGIPANFGNLSSLQELLLGSNQLTGSIPTSLGTLSSLRKLELGAN